MRWMVPLVFPVAIAFAGCTSPADAQGRDSDATSTPADCPRTGTPMVRIVGPGDRTFCIDTSEVSQRDYAKFLAAGAPKPQGEPGFCEGMAELQYAPGVDPVTDGPGGYGCPKGSFDPDEHADRPVACVEWCSANAYCRWAGKRLCGAFDRKVPLTPGTEMFNDPAASEWHYACTSGGKYPSETGGPEASGCGGLADLSMDSACRSPDAPFSAIRDLDGSVAEWAGSCTSAPSPNGAGNLVTCMLFGGSFKDPSLRCEMGTVTGRGAYSNEKGIRCCAD